MDTLNDLQNMIDKSSAFAKRNEIELRGNGRESGNVYIVPEMELLAFRDKLGEYIQYEQSHKVTVQEPKKSKKERSQKATAAVDESFLFSSWKELICQVMN